MANTELPDGKGARFVSAGTRPDPGLATYRRVAASEVKQVLTHANNSEHVSTAGIVEYAEANVVQPVGDTGSPYYSTLGLGTSTAPVPGPDTDGYAVDKIDEAGGTLQVVTTKCTESSMGATTPMGVSMKRPESSMGSCHPTAAVTQERVYHAAHLG